MAPVQAADGMARPKAGSAAAGSADAQPSSAAGTSANISSSNSSNISSKSSSTQAASASPSSATSSGGSTPAAKRSIGSSATGAPKKKKKKKGTGSKKKGRAKAKPSTWVDQVRKHALQGPGLLAVCAVAGVATVWGVMSLVRRLRSGGAGGNSAAGGKGGKPAPAPCANVKPSAKCVALADGSACVVRRTIAADNSCMFNAVAYCMHGSKQKAAFLRNVVAREVSSDPETYSTAFLGMPNAAYCQWIINPVNWGGGIELSILARHYTRELSAWNIETGKQHVFGEEAGYLRQAMLIYTGTHYDALAIAKHPRAPESEDKTEFNPRTKTGKMILAAAQKLTELSKKGGKGGASRAPPPAKKPTANGTAANTNTNSTPAAAQAPAASQLRCEECQVVLGGQAEAAKHATSTGHARFTQVAAAQQQAGPAAAPQKPMAAAAGKAAGQSG